MRRAFLALAVAGALALLLATVPAGAQDGFTAEFDDDSVVAGANTTLHLEGAAGETVSVRSPRLSNEAVAAVLGGDPTTDGGVIIEVPEDGNVTATFDGFACRAGSYTFRVRHDGETANASVDVVSTAVAKTAFTDAVVYAAPNGTAAVRVATECPGGDARLTLAGDGYAASATLSFDAPGRATLLIDAAAAGDGDPATTFTAENATLANATVHRADGSPLATGEYDLNVSVNGEETDVAVLNVTRAGTDLTANFANDSVTVPGEDDAVALRVGNASGREVRVRSPDLPAGLLAEMLDGERAGDAVRVTVPADGTLTVRLPERLECHAGERTLVVERLAGEARASLTVGTDDAPETHFYDPTGEPDDGRVPVPLSVGTCVDDARVVVSAVDGPFRATATVAGPDRRSTLLFDVANARADGAVFAGDGDLRVLDQSVEARGAFGAGDYRVALYADGERVDRRRLSVPAETPTQTVARTVTLTPTATATPTPPGPEPTDASPRTGDGETTTAAPGFGPAAVLTAVAAFVARRR